MGNKVIKISGGSSQASAAAPSSAVYVDLNMRAAPNPRNPMPQITDAKYKMFVHLAQEHPGILKAQDLVLTDPDRAQIKLLYGIDYDMFKRDYDLFLKFGSWKVSTNEDVNAVRGSLHNIFTWIPGERILLPEFGTNLRKILYEGITPFNVERIMAEIRHCVSEWEPRVEIQKVVNMSNVDDTEDNTVHIEVLYTIPGLTQEQLYSEPLVYQKV